MTRQIILEVDDDDFRDIQKEFARRQKRIAKGFELPDGESCLRGAIVGEIVRDLWEYRDLYESERR